MSAEPVRFEFENGHVGVVNKKVAEMMEAKGEGKLIKGVPEPVVKKGAEAEKK